MRALELKRGDIIDFNYGEAFPHVEMVVVGVDSDRLGPFAVAIDAAGLKNRVYTDSIDRSLNGSPIGWKLIKRAAHELRREIVESNQ